MTHEEEQDQIHRAIMRNFDFADYRFRNSQKQREKDMAFQSAMRNLCPHHNGTDKR